VKWTPSFDRGSFQPWTRVHGGTSVSGGSIGTAIPASTTAVIGEVALEVLQAFYEEELLDGPLVISKVSVRRL
jgi:hypothetical protein